MRLSKGVSARLAVVCLALLLASVLAFAQTGSGIIRGTVQDASQAVIPGAKVRLTNLSTNVTQEANSSTAGIYYFASVPNGRYQVDVEAEGFKKWTGTLLLAVGQTAVVDATMEVGTLASTVEVTGAAPLITTEGMSVANVKDSLRIHQLPLNGRDVTNLFNLTPGVEGGGAPRVNGSKVGSAEILQDGISQVDRFGGGISRVRPGLDTVEEFRIETCRLQR